MARPSEYDFEFLKKYKDINVIYALYIDEKIYRYIGQSNNVYERFCNHLRNHTSETNTKKFNWINKHKSKIRIKVLSINPNNIDEKEIELIKLYKNNDLLNICSGGKNNLSRIKHFNDYNTIDHLKEINKSIDEIIKYKKAKGIDVKISKLTKNDISQICKIESNLKYNGV